MPRFSLEGRWTALVRLRLAAFRSMLADDDGDARTLALIDRWRLFSWLHPFQAAALLCFTVAASALIVLVVGFLLWRPVQARCPAPFGCLRHPEKGWSPRRGPD